jgi:membrane fusion protein, heavy metal efflux system
MNTIFTKTGIFISLLTLAAGCGPSEKDVPAEPAMENELRLTSEQIQRLGLTTAALKDFAVEQTLTAQGIFDVPPQNLVTLHVPMGGYVKNTSLLQGKSVRKGDVLVELVHPDYLQLQQDYREAVGRLVYAQTDLERQQELAKGNANAAKALQLASAEFISRQAHADGLRSRLKLLSLDPLQIEKGMLSQSVKIYAPLSGYIGEVNINLGKYVSPTESFATLINLDHIHVELEVFEKDVPLLRKGQKIYYRTGNDTTRHLASVFMIGKEISKSRTVRVHGHPEKINLFAIPGMFVSAEVVVGSSVRQVVPAESVVSFENKKFVFVEESDRYQMVEVRSEAVDQNQASVEWVLPGKKPVRVVKSGAYTLLSMLKNAEEE